MSFEIRALHTDPRIVQQLSALLGDVVAQGGSVGFMHPLPIAAAAAFWQGALAATERGARVILGGFNEAELVGTVSLVLDLPPNQPHRADLAKLMVHPACRGRGLAALLVQAAERQAVRHGRNLLVLDTASEDGARRVYERLGYTLAGEIPEYALKPHGGLTGTLVFWKRLGPS